MSRTRSRKQPATVEPWKPLAEGEPLETSQQFDALAIELGTRADELLSATATAYLEAISELRLTKEAELASGAPWPTEEPQ